MNLILINMTYFPIYFTYFLVNLGNQLIKFKSNLFIKIYSKYEFINYIENNIIFII